MSMGFPLELSETDRLLITLGEAEINLNSRRSDVAEETKSRWLSADLLFDKETLGGTVLKGITYPDLIVIQ